MRTVNARRRDVVTELVRAMLLFASLGANACSGDDSGGTCPTLSGSWSLTGNCQGLSACTVAQTGCSVSIQCSDGTALTGSASGSSLDFSNATLRCTGSIDESSVVKPTVDGACSYSGGSCSFDAECDSGSCATSNQAGAGGESGAGGSATSGSGGSSGGSACTRFPGSRAGSAAANYDDACSAAGDPPDFYENNCSSPPSPSCVAISGNIPIRAGDSIYISGGFCCPS
jgi:hypothetical protein